MHAFLSQFLPFTFPKIHVNLYSYANPMTTLFTRTSSQSISSMFFFYIYFFPSLIPTSNPPDSVATFSGSTSTHCFTRYQSRSARPESSYRDQTKLNGCSVASVCLQFAGAGLPLTTHGLRVSNFFLSFSSSDATKRKKWRGEEGKGREE